MDSEEVAQQLGDQQPVADALDVVEGDLVGVGVVAEVGKDRSGQVAVTEGVGEVVLVEIGEFRARRQLAPEE